MTSTLIWITGASSGIGAALAETVPFDDARVFDISRSGGTPGTEHVPADLSDPSAWAAVEAHLASQIGAFGGERVVLVHNAGTLEPMGFAGEVDSEAYRRNVVLNSGAPQALGHAFLKAAAAFRGEAHLLMLSSGAATSPYPGWSSYCAGKAALDMWCRTAGEEQRLRAERGQPSARVVSVAPGVVATPMQERIRAMSPQDFPGVAKFVGLHERGELKDPADAARGIWGLLERELPSGSVVDLRTLS
ncbi:MAG TPA: SDR family NAD(P)-dependent oxidoreductase [Egibacteraceae bacterium]|nr:SDR family NAD(P)-dependent oxidoreductase [Egibacteraceae bacterium]